MHVYGTRREQFGAIATAFREHALKNPEAMMKKPLSLDEYLQELKAEEKAAQRKIRKKKAGRRHPKGRA